MRRHFIFQVHSRDPSPTGTGTIVGWLEFYKLDVLDDTYVRLDYPGVPPIAGDLLWFQVDDVVIARVTLQDAYLDPLSAFYEFRYAGADVRRVHGIHNGHARSGALPTTVGDRWLRFSDQQNHVPAGGP